MSFLIVLSERGGGDIPPVVALACGLRDRGHQVKVLCDESTAKFIASTNLPLATFPPELDQRGQITRWFGKLRETGNGSQVEIPNPMIEWASPLVPFSEEVLSDFRPDLILSTLFGIGLACELSNISGVPWCFVNPSFYFGDHAERDWEEDWYGPNIPRLARDCFLPIARQADITLHATDPDFDFPPARLPSNHFYVGFLLWEPSIKGFDFLDEPGDPWALITLSTVRQDDELTLADSSLKALANRPVRSLLTQPDEDIRDALGEIPANAMISGFVPHIQVLQRSSIVINHAGHGIVSKALRHGVPMVLLPWDRDQPGVAVRAKKLGVAQVVPREEASPERVRAAVASAFEDFRYREAATSQSERLARIDSVSVACVLLEGL
jgi:UDP:flavonoid glycosyltransferase YjiC (YdhE family)